LSPVHVQWRVHACEFRTGEVTALEFTCFWQGVLVTSSQQTWPLMRLPASATSCFMSAPIAASFAQVWSVPQRLRTTESLCSDRGRLSLKDFGRKHYSTSVSRLDTSCAPEGFIGTFDIAKLCDGVVHENIEATLMLLARMSHNQWLSTYVKRQLSGMNTRYHVLTSTSNGIMSPSYSYVLERFYFSNTLMATASCVEELHPKCYSDNSSSLFTVMPTTNNVDKCESFIILLESTHQH